MNTTIINSRHGTTFIWKPCLHEIKETALPECPMCRIKELQAENKIVVQDMLLYQKQRDECKAKLDAALMDLRNHDFQAKEYLAEHGNWGNCKFRLRLDAVKALPDKWELDFDTNPVHELTPRNCAVELRAAIGEQGNE